MSPGSSLHCAARVALLALLVGCSSETDSGGDTGNGPGTGAMTGSGGGSGTGGVSAGGAGGAGAALCGNGKVDTGEQCDAGGANGAGTGCELDCRFSCQTDADCSDAEPCDGVEVCTTVATGKACAAGTPLADGSACGPANVCKGAVCIPSVCGNGVIEPGEGCEPPNTATCDATCQSLLCGDGIISTGEQCDDTNGLNLDGCDATCRYEMVLRLTKLTIVKDPPASYCPYPANTFGAACAQPLLDGMNVENQPDVDGGLVNVLIHIRGLADLTGQTDSTFSTSLYRGQLDPKYPGTWSAGALDWWYIADPTAFDASGDPLISALSTLSAGVITTAPQDTYFSHFLIRDAVIRANIDVPPGANQPAPPPSALASGLTTFESISGDQVGMGACGAVTVGSLAETLVPEELTAGQDKCLSSCPNSKSYTYCGAGNPVGPGCNSMLDLVVGGCKVTSLCIPLTIPTQPDVGTNGNPPEPLVAGSSDNKVQVTQPLDGYSVVARVTANRGHITNNLP